MSMAPRVHSSATICRLQEQKSAYEPAQHTWIPPPQDKPTLPVKCPAQAPKQRELCRRHPFMRAPRMKPHRGVVVVDGGGVVHGHGRDRGVLATGAVDMKRSAAINPTSLFRPLRTDTTGHQRRTRQRQQAGERADKAFSPCK